MSLATLLLQFDRDFPGDPDQEIEIPGDLWAAWIREARAETDQAKPYQLGIIACSKSKLQTSEGGAVRARYLYTGQLFKASIAVTDLLCDRTLILSAKHGVVDPDRLIQTYDQKLPTGPGLTQWALFVDGLLPETQGKKVLCLAPEPYWRPLPSSSWERPLKGLGIGEQKAALKKLARAA